jgi:hypothetical protein
VAKEGNIFIFQDGQKCMVVNNTIKQGGYNYDGTYNMWDDSRYLLVNLDTGKVELHYRYNIPYEHGEPYIPMWGGVAKVVKNIGDLMK